LVLSLEQRGIPLEHLHVLDVDRHPELCDLPEFVGRSGSFHCADGALGSGRSMKYKAIIKQDADWWIGWVEDVPGVNVQERTREELLISLREALTDILESKENL